jgi:rubredoxin
MDIVCNCKFCLFNIHGFCTERPHQIQPNSRECPQHQLSKNQFQNSKKFQKILDKNKEILYNYF